MGGAATLSGLRSAGTVLINNVPKLSSPAVQQSCLQCAVCTCRDALIGTDSVSAVAIIQTQLSAARAAIAQLCGDGSSPLQAAAPVECNDGDAAVHIDKPRSSPESSAYSTATDTSLCGAHSAEVAAPEEQQSPVMRRSQPLPSARCHHQDACILTLISTPQSLPAAVSPLTLILPPRNCT